MREAMRDALRALRLRRVEDALTLKRLRLSIESGIADLERGDHEDVDEADLAGWLDRLIEPPDSDAQGASAAPSRSTLA